MCQPLDLAPPSLPTLNYYKERHEYTAVIELPYNITDVIDTLVVDIEVTIPDNQSNGGVEVLRADPKLESIEIKHDKQLIFTGKNLSVPALQFKWATQPIIQGVIHEDIIQGNRSAGQVENKDNSNSNVVGGFAMKWHVNGSNTTNDSNKEQLWNQKYNPDENNQNVLTLMKLVRECKRKNVDEKDLWKSLLKHRWSSGILKYSPCLNEYQEKRVILKTAQELNLDHSVDTRVPDEDLAFGKELFAVMKCPYARTGEAAKMLQLFKHLLTSHSLKTVVASTIRNIQPMAGDAVKDFTAINMWYERLDSRYNFSLGPAILPLLRTDNLTQLAKLDPPYLKDFKASIDKHQPGNISTSFGNNLTLIDV